MNVLGAIRALVLTPWAMFQFWRALSARERKDWTTMTASLRSIADAGLDGDVDWVLLGIGFAQQGRFPEALWYLERVRPRELHKLAQPYYFNEYAYVLTRIGRRSEAETLLREVSRERWPERQRRWADDLLASSNPVPTPPPHSEKLPLLH